MEHKTLESGTTTIGIVCKNGIVLAGDKRANAGYIAHKKVTKVVKIDEFMAITTAGNVSDIQLIGRVVKAELKLKEIQTNRRNTVREVANLLGGLLYNNLRKPSMVPGVSSHLLGGKDPAGYHLYHCDIDGSVLEYEDYCADGSGMVFALGVLETQFKKDMSIEEGKKLALKAINTAIHRDPNSGNGIDIVTITEQGAVFETTKVIEDNLE